MGERSEFAGRVILLKTAEQSIQEMHFILPAMKPTKRLGVFGDLCFRKICLHNDTMQIKETTHNDVILLNI